MPDKSKGPNRKRRRAFMLYFSEQECAILERLSEASGLRPTKVLRWLLHDAEARKATPPPFQPWL